MSQTILFNGKESPSIFSLFDEEETIITCGDDHSEDDRYFVRSKLTDEVLFVFRVGGGRLPYMSFRQIGVRDRTRMVDDCAIQLNKDISVYSVNELTLIKSFIKYALVK